MSKKNELLYVGILFTLIVFTFVGIILGIVGYSRSNSYYLKKNGETVYCNSNIWMQLKNDKISGYFLCSYYKPKDENEYNSKYKKWNGQYPEGYFWINEKEAN